MEVISISLALFKALLRRRKSSLVKKTYQTTEANEIIDTEELTIATLLNWHNL